MYAGPSANAVVYSPAMGSAAFIEVSIDAPGELGIMNAITQNASPPLPPSRAAVTRLLSAWRSGDSAALQRLTPLVYDELRNLARRYMRSERAGHTLQATAVVNEAFVRLLDMDVPWQDRVHFFAVAARLMRRILVDHAKARSRVKRGGPMTFASLDGVEDSAPASGSEIDVIEIDHALEKLAVHDARLAQIVELHYFGGLTYHEMALALNISEATVHRDMRLAKAWIFSQIANRRP